VTCAGSAAGAQTRRFKTLGGVRLEAGFALRAGLDATACRPVPGDHVVITRGPKPRLDLRLLRICRQATRTNVSSSSTMSAGE
jgi:hypothetical protein